MEDISQVQIHWVLIEKKALYCTVLYSTLLYCTLPYCTVLFYGTSTCTSLESCTSTLVYLKPVQLVYSVQQKK